MSAPALGARPADALGRPICDVLSFLSVKPCLPAARIARRLHLKITV